jgi:hypothetical protein
MTDDGDPLAAADRRGVEWTLPAGVYRVDANLTLTSRVRFEQGAKIKPSRGALVTFSAGYDAAETQHVFDLAEGGMCFSKVPCRSTQYHWGAVGNGVADDTAAIQACIDNALYFNGSKVCRLARGDHFISRLILNWGSTRSYRSITLAGDRDAFDGGPFADFGGTVLRAEKTWENAIEIRSARRVVIRDLTLAGPWKRHIESRRLGHSAAKFDSSVPANWVPRVCPAFATTQYAYSAGIHMDPRCGPAPATKYSDVSYPCYGRPEGDAQYGLSASSQLTLERVTITGFGVGLAVKGCTQDGNSDFVSLVDCDVTCNQYGVAWGHTQCRQITAERCRFTNCYRAFDTSAIGLRNGRPQVLAVGCDFDQCCEIINAPNMNWGGYVALQGCYGELLYRIGDVSHAASAAAGCFSIRDCHFAFSNRGGYFNVPKSIVKSSRTPLSISGGDVSLVDLSMPFVIDGEPELCEVSTTITGANWESGDAIGRAIAVGSTCHVMFLNENQGPWKGQGAYAPAYDPSTGGEVAFDDRQRYRDVALSNASRLIPFCARQALGYSARSASGLPVALGSHRWKTSDRAIESVAHSGRTLTLIHAQKSTNLGDLQNWGLVKGSLLYDSAKGNLYVVDDQKRGVARCTLLNNYDGRSGEPIAPSDASGAFYWIPCGYFMPDHPHQFSYASGSTSVTLARSDGLAASAGDVPVGAARVAADAAEAMSPVPQSSSAVTAVSAGPPASLTLSGPAKATRNEGAGLWLISRP